MLRRHPKVRALPALAAVMLFGALACDSGTNPIRVGPPAKLVIVSGNQQQATVGTELPYAVVIQVTDADGNPVQGQLINFRVTSGGGSVFAGSSLTNGNGQARERWTLGTDASSAQTLEARAVDNATGVPLVFAMFSATAVAGPASSLDKVGGDAQNGSVGQPTPTAPSVRVRDQYGNPVGGATVAFAVTSGAGTVSAPSVVTGANGIASVTWTLGTTAGAQSLTATVGGITPASFTATAAPVGAVRLSTPIGPATAQPGVYIQVTTTLLDAYGNQVPQAGVPVTIANGTGGGSLAGTTTVATDGSGIAHFTIQINALAGPHTLVVSSPGLTGATSANIQVVTGPGLVIQKVSGDAQVDTIQAPLNPLVVRVTDAGGNPIVGQPVKFFVGVVETGTAYNYNNTASVTGGIQQTGADGTASPTSVSLGTCFDYAPCPPPIIVATLDMNASAGSADAGPYTTFTATIKPGNPVALTGSWAPLTPGSSAPAGSKLSFTPVVRVTDRLGNGINGLTVTFVVTKGGGTLTGATPTTENDRYDQRSGMNHAGFGYLGSWTLGPTPGTNTVEGRFGTLTPVVFTMTGT